MRRLDVLLLAGAVDDGGVVLRRCATRLARPSMSSVTFSSLMPRSSEITWPPVRTAMSSSMALRRSPKPGALTAATFRPPRSLLTTSVASASPSTSSAMISSGLPVCTTASSSGSSGCRLDELLLVDEDVGLLELGDHLVGVGDEVGREIAAVELHALDDFELGLEALGLLDRDDALVADLLHGLGDHVADRLLAVGRDGADLGDLARLFLTFLERFLMSSTTWRTALSMPRFRSIGFMPAATAFMPSRTIAWASTRRGGGAVAGHVVGLLGRPRAPSARPCSRTCPRARSPWRRSRRPWSCAARRTTSRG